ncbi:MAG: class I SAM-dependent methyltransferase [Mycobacterium sp.]
MNTDTAQSVSLWALGDYPAVASEVIAPLGPILVTACGMGPRVRVLDVAAGSGNVAIPAARSGADVVASDLTPELLAAGRLMAARAGVEIDWQVADAQALPFDNNDFDVVVSCVGVMFAPRHQDSADELVRVCRPGGTIGLINWTPEGFIGQMFAAMKPFAAAPPPGAGPPPLWGNPAHVRTLLADRTIEVTAERRMLTVDRFATAEEFCDFFKACYGPTIAVYARIAEDPVRTAELDDALVELARRHDRGDGRVLMDWEYLLYIARKRG